MLDVVKSAWTLVVREVEHERASLLIMGPEPTAARLLGDVVETLRGQHVFVVPERADLAWATGGDARVLVPDDALGSTRHAIVRSCLRQDPDGFVLQAPGAALPWELLVQTALTGHQVIVHVSDALDEDAALGGLRTSSTAASLAACSALPWLVVLDDAGVERLVVTDGALGPSAVTAWRRGDPVPASLRDLWPGSAVADPVEQPLEPLDLALVERVRALVSPHVRTCFDLLTAWSTCEPASSKLGGVPMLGPGEPWPACGCGAALLLAVQLARDPLPAEALVCFPEGAGWLQLFYCDHPACSVADAWTARAPNKLLRWLPLAGAAVPSHVPEAALLGDAFDVEAWESRPETPATDDLGDASEAARDDRTVLADHVEARTRARRLGLAVPDEPTPEHDLVLLAGPSTGDKLLGWPWWAQAPGWQTCPRCGARMQPLFQLDAEAGTGRFAADGTGHITQCPTHLDQLAFAWACG